MRRCFTLIELLVVVAVIAVLAALLLPALAKSRDRATRVLCMSNQRQSLIACLTYADEQANQLPTQYAPAGTDWPMGIYYINTGSEHYDLRTPLKGYIGSFEVWGCPAVMAVPIDHPSNIRVGCYGSRYYFPGVRNPNFNNSPAPTAIVQVSKASDRVMLQDVMVDATATAGGMWAFNHGSGSLSVLADNPSARSYSSLSRSSTRGANLGYYDGHVEWWDTLKLQKVGITSSPNSSVYIYSRLPLN